MQTTGNLGLKKPEGTDIVDIADLNGNMDILDNAVNGKMDKVTGKQLSTNDYTTAEKTKLAGVATGANNYSHPNHTGDITSTGDGVTAISAGVIVNADVNAAAGIDASKIGTGVVSNAEFGYLDGVTGGIQGQLDSKVPLTDYVRQPGYAVDSGTANAKVITLSPAPTSYVDGMAVSFKNAVLSTGAATININGLGNKSIVKSNGSALSSGNLKAGSIYTIRYNATTGNFILQGEGGEYGTATAADVISGKTIGSDTGLVTGVIPLNPTTFSNKIATADKVVSSNSGDSKMHVYVRPFKEGNTTGTTTAYSGDVWMDVLADDLRPENFLAGKNMLGVAGAIPTITGTDTAATVAHYPNDDLAVYVNRGYRAGGIGGGEVKVPVDMLKGQYPQINADNLRAGVSAWGITGALQPAGMVTLSNVGPPSGPQANNNGTYELLRIPAAAKFAGLIGSLKYWARSGSSSRIIHLFFRDSAGVICNCKYTSAGNTDDSQSNVYTGFYLDKSKRTIVTNSGQVSSGSTMGSGALGGWDTMYNGNVGFGAGGALPANFNVNGDISLLVEISSSYGEGYDSARADGILVYW
ncbi:hypothetical protein [Paenibacillus pseudetheri]|uniref:Tail fiber protein n=1 Tax=Paenibacillus pseudetheri TaxID=2897682 RepID=A0ABN8FP97_9BACL|nr:hypothetical protein [Paenibacillus pseudetheri]CAH1057635.1 hypothetical protein PAECIP111894_03793 [Paenibacillus pseudetheri]